MSKDIKQYMKYYVGCEVAELPKGKHDGMMIDRIISVEENGNIFVSNGYMIEAEKVKPILRKLTAMTDAELKERIFSSREHYERWLIANDRRWHIDDLHWFLKNGFDMFDLIREGLAIDKDSLKG